MATLAYKLNITNFKVNISGNEKETLVFSLPTNRGDYPDELTWLLLKNLGNFHHNNQRHEHQIANDYFISLYVEMCRGEEETRKNPASVAPTQNQSEINKKIWCGIPLFYEQ